jgi:signal transduction histidine kinase
MLRVDGDGAYVLVDSEWLQDVLLLLLSNAAQYSSSGQKISLRVHGSTLAIEDEGEGISAVDLPYVFDRFYRGKSTVEGFGLGLSICRDLIEQMGGSITLNSRTGSGTRVEVQLPEADANA